MATDGDTNRETLTVIEVARILGIGRNHAYLLARSNEIPGVIRLGRRVLIKRKVFQDWLAGSSDSVTVLDSSATQQHDCYPSDQ